MDGASIPQEFWTFIRGPFEGKYRNASVCHDVACNERKHRWQDVHHMFYDGCGAARSRMQGLRRCFWAVWNFGPKWVVMLPAFRGPLPRITGTPTPGLIKKPQSPEEVRAVYERIKRENPSLSDIEKGKL